MKRAFIIHRWDGSSDEPLYQWLASQLEEQSFRVEIPRMPNPGRPTIEEWTGKLEEVVGSPESAIFIGHSIGCQAILRYLEKSKGSDFVGGVVLIAPWLYLTGLESEEEKSIARPWVETEIHNPDVFRHISHGKVTAIFSDNDPYVPKENWEEFERRFGAKVIIEKRKGHFTEEDGVTELPSALEAVLALR